MSVVYIACMQFQTCKWGSFRTGILVGGWRQKVKERRVKKEIDGKISSKKYVYTQYIINWHLLIKKVQAKCVMKLAGMIAR